MVLSAQAFEFQPNLGMARVRVVVQCAIIVTEHEHLNGDAALAPKE